jgi:hypothetical protein
VINAWIEIGFGLGGLVGSDVGVALGRAALAEAALVAVDATLGVVDDGWSPGAVVGAPEVQAAKSRTAGSTESAFTEFSIVGAHVGDLNQSTPGNWSATSQRQVVIIASTRIRHSRSKS